MAGLLCEYNFRLHVASDIGIDSYFLPPQNINMQEHLNKITEWTQENLMVLNEQKSKYIVFNRAMADFNTRLTINQNVIDQGHAARLLGVIISDDLSFEKNTDVICKRAYARISMITKLKYVGVCVPTSLIFIPCLFAACWSTAVLAGIPHSPNYCRTTLNTYSGLP